VDRQYWLDRWVRNEIGFHQPSVNPLLAELWTAVSQGSQPGTVFVPLCGKSLDMAWLREQGHLVFGVDLSATALEDFFEHQSLPYTRRAEIDGFVQFDNAGFQLLAGDFFSLGPDQIPQVQCIYDRAALIALPPPLQVRYVAHLLGLLPYRPPVFLITLDYDSTEMEGPPFSTDEAQVTQLFGSHYVIRPLAERDVLADHPGLANKGLSRLKEKAFYLTAAN
jgi:thiopurine S-methyltransferase